MTKRVIGVRLSDEDFISKFHSLYEKRESGCWEWIGGKVGGYGIIYRDGKSWKAHRMAYKLARGLIPEGKCVCHSCDNPSCVNPEHLWIGDNKDNMRDMKAKCRARGPIGQGNAAAKLTESDVLKIRELYELGETQPKIAAKYGIDQTSVSEIVRGKTWAHLPFMPPKISKHSKPRGVPYSSDWFIEHAAMSAVECK